MSAFLHNANPTTTGAAVGALTAVQAAAFVAACELFAAGRLQLVYTDDGRPAVVATQDPRA